MTENRWLKLNPLLLVTLLLASPLSLLAAEPLAVTIPPAAQLLERLHPAHPRLLASAADLERLKALEASEPLLRAWHTNLQTQAQAILKAPVSRYELPDGKRLLATSRRVLERIYTLGLLYRLEGEPRYAARAWEELAAAAAFKDWNPPHFLDTAEMTHAFGIGYDWFYEAWTPEQRSQLRQAMVEKGFKPALLIYRGHKGWSTARHNWNQVCNGGIGMGALALAEVEPELAGELLHEGLQSIQLAMAEFAPDGAWKEGPGYWNYAVRYNVAILAGLQTALGSDFGLSKIAGFEQTGFFPLYMSGPLGRTFNYADGGEHSIHAPELFWLGRQFHQPALGAYERQVGTPSALDYVWFDSRGTGPKAAGLPLDKYLRGAEVVLLRSQWEEPKALFVGFKAGDNKANHSHLDLGSFVFDALGARWASDLGSDDYNLPGYFGGHRWEYYRLRAEGQNTLLINPGQGPDQLPSAKGRILRFESRPEQAFAIADLTPAYAKDATKVWRGLALLERDQLLVQDEIQAEAPAEVWWFMHTHAAIKIEDKGRSALLHQAGVQLRAELLEPAGASFEILEAQPLASSPQPPKQASNSGVRKLSIHLKAISTTRIAVRLLPLGPGLDSTNAAPKLSALADWR